MAFIIFFVILLISFSKCDEQYINEFEDTLEIFCDSQKLDFAFNFYEEDYYPEGILIKFKINKHYEQIVKQIVYNDNIYFKEFSQLIKRYAKSIKK